MGEHAQVADGDGTPAFAELSPRQKAFSSAGAVLKHPASWLSAGNALLAFHLSKLNEANLLEAATDAGPAAISTAVIVATVVAANAKDQIAKLPFYIHGGLTVATAYLGFDSTMAEHGTDLIQLATDPETATQFWGNTAIAGWGAGHLVTAVKQTSERFNRLSGQANMALYGSADISAVYSNPVGPAPEALVPAVAGFVRSFVPTKDDVSDYQTLLGKMGWHVTPSRLFATGYIINGLIALKDDPGFAAPNIMFGLGVLNFDGSTFGAKQNEVLVDYVAEKTGVAKEAAREKIAPLIASLQDRMGIAKNPDGAPDADWSEPTAFPESEPPENGR